jgi:Phosphopantetheine attachment site
VSNEHCHALRLRPTEPVSPQVLGGNSLLAMRIRAAMRARGLPPVGLRDLFRRPTIRAAVTVLGADLTPAPATTVATA